MYSGAVTALMASKWEDFPIDFVLVLANAHYYTTPTWSGDLNKIGNW